MTADQPGEFGLLCVFQSGHEVLHGDDAKPDHGVADGAIGSLLGVKVGEQLGGKTGSGKTSKFSASDGHEDLFELTRRLTGGPGCKNKLRTAAGLS